MEKYHELGKADVRIDGQDLIFEFEDKSSARMWISPDSMRNLMRQVFNGPQYARSDDAVPIPPRHVDG